METIKKKKSWWKITLAVLLALLIVLGVTVGVIMKKTVLVKYPELEGKPETGTWYRITPKGTRSSDGSEWHGLIKPGSKDKLVVYFFGGGASINGYTSEHGKEFFATTAKIQDFVTKGGISSDAEENPFRDWTFLVLPYATGDFHCGTGEYRYKDGDQEKTVYHTGYENYSAFLKAAKPYIGEPETLLVTGFSAGGFATSLLADDVIDHYPSAKNITVCVDSSLLLYKDWHKTATGLWKAPKEISKRLTGDNLVLDSLTALYKKRGDQVKILFDCSYRDNTLQEYQAFIRTGKMEKSKANGDRFRKDLGEMVSALKKNIPEIGLFVWSYDEDKETGNTQHTIISSDAVFESLEDDTSIADWIKEAVDGNVETHGLHLL